MFQQRRFLLFCVSLLLLTFVAFAYVVACDFINLDDSAYVTRNPFILGGLTPANIRWAFSDAVDVAGLWIPLTWLSLQLDATLFGPRGAWGFHLTNLLLHAANVVLLFWTLRRLTGQEWLSFVAALLFAVHPLRVESVAWVTERKDMLSALFWILTLAAYHHYALAPSLRRYLLVLLCFVLGAMSKPMVVTLPFVLLLLDYWPLQRTRLRWGAGSTTNPVSPRNRVSATPVGPPAVAWHRLLLEKAPLFVMAGILSYFTIVFSRSLGAVASLTHISVADRLVNAVMGYLGYLEKTFWPANLMAFYPIHPYPVWQPLLAGLALVGLTLLIVCAARKCPPAVVGWLWFVGTLVPVSGLVQAGDQAFADRFTYVPHMGFVILVVWGLGQVKWWQSVSTSFTTLILALLTLVLVILTSVQTWYWRDSLTLFSRALSIDEENHVAHICVGRHYFELGNLDLAEHHHVRAVELQPHMHSYHYAYALLLVKRRDVEKAIHHFRETVRLKPYHDEAHGALGVVLLNDKRWQDARFHLRKHVDLQPSSSDGHANLGLLHFFQGENEPALEHFTRALQIEPGLANVYLHRGVLLGRLGRWADAEVDLTQAVVYQPADRMRRAELAHAYYKQGKYAAANQEYRALMSAPPTWPAEGSWLAKTAAAAVNMATHPEPSQRDPLRARELALQICEATEFKEPRWLDTLALTHAALGDFEQAQQTARTALTLANDPALRRQLDERLRLYEQRQMVEVPRKANGKNEKN